MMPRDLGQMTNRSGQYQSRFPAVGGIVTTDKPILQIPQRQGADQSCLGGIGVNNGFCASWAARVSHVSYPLDGNVYHCLMSCSVEKA